MTAPARISERDITRATKAVKAAGFERARIVLDLQAQKIEIILGEDPAPPAPPKDVWTDDDG